MLKETELSFLHPALLNLDAMAGTLAATLDHRVRFLP